MENNKEGKEKEITLIPPKEIIEAVKCSLCDSSLSVSPVNLIAEDGTQYKCGRCASVKTVISTRANMYELLAKLMTFPCIYKDCEEKLLWGKVREHEKVCEHRTSVCPKQQCQEVLKLSTIAAHFKAEHKEAYHSDVFTVSKVHGYYNLDVLEKDGKTFLIVFDYDEHNLGISVCSLDGEITSQYEVNLKSDSSKFSLNVYNQTTILFNEREHCFKCITNNCKSKYHIYKNQRKEIIKRLNTKISRDCIKKMFGSSIVHYTINVLDGKVDSNEDIMEVVVKKEKLFRRMLDCPICEIFMYAPIYQCIAGHSLCNQCKAKNSKCPKCQAAIENTRNYTLEEISEGLGFPKIKTEENGEVTGGVKRAAEEDEEVVKSRKK